MPIEKQNISINFLQGLDLKTDPFQLSPGKFLRLQNSVFTTANQLNKRNGFNVLPGPTGTISQLTTFQGNLIASGDYLQALLRGASSWYNQGKLQQVDLSALPIARGTLSQTAVDTALSFSNNLLCTVWTDSASDTYYQVQDSTTGQLITSPTQIPTAINPRVFLLGNNFVITFVATVSASLHLQYISIPIVNPTSVTLPVDISTQINASTPVYDAVVASTNLYLSWSGSDGGGALRSKYITPALVQSSPKAIAGRTPSLISVTADNSGASAIIYQSFYDSGTIYTHAYSVSLGEILAITTVIAAANTVQVTSAAINGIVTIYSETSNNYSYVSKRSDYVKSIPVTQAGVVGASSFLKRGVGLASKAFLIDDSIYVLLVYGSANSGLLQPTYFLSDSLGNVISKLAYSNGGTYYTGILPSVSTDDGYAYFAYLFKDFLAAVNPENLTPPSSTSNIYTQTGINLASVNFYPDQKPTVEIGKNLHFTGGITWAYDGVKPVEQNFHLYPEDIAATWSATGGSIHAQPDSATNTNAYYYQVTYEWTDAQGNLHRSAPSVPVAVTTTSNGTTGSISLDIPTLRVTFKSAVRIVIYRWSVANQIYYQVTSISSPTLNSTTVDSVNYVDTLADSSIVGNNIIYTTGGVIENTGPPATNVMATYKSRIFLLNSESKNSFFFSKQVIQDTPVEFSDLLTYFVAPTIGAQGSTGEITAAAALDDKFIIFKRDAIYYMVGNGPDNTGSNNDFSEPVYITGNVGCVNQNSVVVMPRGIMFQSDKGIWLLGRDLSTTYIGAPVETFNSYTVTSSLAIPGTNQVRFSLDNNVMLMYDYFYDQWGTFNLFDVQSSTLFQEMHTFLNADEVIYQENSDSYMDGSNPVLMGFTTGWMNFAGIQGFQRAYFMYLLGVFYSPHKIRLQVAYDYGSPEQNILISPTNYAGTYGAGTSGSYYGSDTFYGGMSNLEQFRIFFNRQKLQSFQITFDEVFDPSYETTPGRGLTLSGMNLVAGIKKGYVPLPASQSVS